MINSPNSPHTGKAGAPSPIPVSSAGGFGTQVGADGFQALPTAGMLSQSVWLPTGNITRTLNIVSIPTVGPSLGFQLGHRAQDDYNGPVGKNWRHNYQARLEIDRSVPTDPPPALITFVDASGQTTDLAADGIGNWWTDTDTSLYQTYQLTNPSGSVWELKTTPEESVWRFEETELVGYPETAGRLVEIEDRFGNTLSLNYAAGKLSSIEDAQGRQISLTYSGDLLSEIEDPREEVHILTYNGGDNLLSVSGPEGCTVSFGYQAESQLITSTTDARGCTTRYTYTGEYPQLATVTFPGGGEIAYDYATTVDGPEEYVGDHDIDRLQTTRVTLPNKQTFEYRFDRSQNLWRVISPSGQIKRYYWSQKERFLYCSEGYPLFRTDGGIKRFPPYDNFENKYTSHTLNDRGDPVAVVNSSGIIDTYDYDEDGRLTVSHPGQANQGVQGNWPGHYGAEGIVLCAFNEDGTDIYRAPAYLDSDLGNAITNGDGIGGSLFARINENDVHLMDGRAPLLGNGSLIAGIGHWKQDGADTLGSSFQFAVNLNQEKTFNLSIYSHSADLSKYDINPLVHQEFFGRDLTLLVEDINGIQSYRILNNAPGIWVTFPVKGDASNPVKVTVTASGGNNRPVVSAIAFDPLEDRRTFYEYTSGDLTKVTDGLGNETTYVYSTDGTLSTATDARGKTTTFEYLDTAKNLTKITDHDSNVTTRTFDENGNILTVTDANSNVTTMTYDGKNRLLTVTDPLSHTTVLEYDGSGNVLSVTDAKLRETLFTYNQDNLLESVENALGQKIYLYYDTGGRLISQKDARGYTTLYSYDKDGCLSKVEAPNGEKTTLSYDFVSRLIAVTGPNGNQESKELVNLLGANNFFRNPDLSQMDPNNPTSIEHWSRSNTSATINPDYVNTYDDGPSLPISVSGYSWSQSDIQLHEGANYLAQARFKRTADLIFTADVRNLEGETEPVSLGQTANESGPDGWDLLGGLPFTIPGDSQFTLSQPSLANFSANWVNEPGSLAGRLDDLRLHMLSVAYKRNKDGQVRSVTTPDGAESTTIRDRFNRVISMQDPSGEETSLVYDALDRVVLISKPSGESLEFAYNEVGALISFKDERDKETVFTYDNLNRLTTITYPDTSTEIFAYDAVSNLTSYTDNQSQAKGFTYDDADRLTVITYPDTSTVEFGYDEVNNLTLMTERNGDTLAYGYDAIDRLVSVTRSAGSGNTTPEWEHTYGYDENGNRISLSDESSELWSASITDSLVYGSSLYGVGEGSTKYGKALYDVNNYPAGRDNLNRLVGVKSAGKVQARFEYDHEGRRTETEFVNSAHTKATLDIVGRPRELVTNSLSGELLSLSYDYDIRSNRTRQVTGYDTFDYKLDTDGKLIGECINRFVEDGVTDFQPGGVTGLSLENDGLECLNLDDDFSGSTINSDRWRLTYRSNTTVERFIGSEVRQDDGLHMVFPRGYTDREGHARYIYHDLKDTFGTTSYHFYTLMEHRRRLEGDFDVRVDLESFQGYSTSVNYDAQAMLYVSANPSERYPDGTYMHLAREHNNGFVVRSNGVADAGLASFDGPVTFRLVRVGATITAYVWNEGTASWDTQSGWERTVTDAPLHVGLGSYTYHQAYVAATFKNFVFEATSAPSFPAVGEYISQVYDAGRPVDWKSLKSQADKPVGTDVQFQISIADSEHGPWSSFIGPDLTSATYFTTDTTNLMGQSFIGRYARYRAVLSGDGTVTPTLKRVEFGYSGSLPSQYRTFSFDPAGNITEKKIAGDSSTVTETRTYNDLNQLTQNVIDDGTTPVTWTYTHDTNGNMTSKTDGTDTYTYVWNVDNQLEEVKLNAVTLVEYIYDSGSRLIQRTENGTTTNYTWDGWDLIREDKTGTITSTTKYLVPEGEVLAFERDGEMFYLHGDALSSTQLITDENGDQVARFVYGAWGEELHATDNVPGGTECRFVGGLGVRTDPVTGLIYMRHRWYSVEEQRFISRDPIGLRGDTNLYQYADNSPVSMIDPHGLNPVLEASAKQDMATGGKKIIIGLGLTQAAPIVVDPGDVAGAAMIGSGAKDVARGVIKYVLAKSTSTLPDGTPSPEPSPSPVPSPKPPCDDEDGEDDTLFWRGRLHLVSDHFYDGLYGPDVQLDKADFQEIIVEYQTRYISTSKKNGYQIWRVNEFGNRGREFQFLYDPVPAVTRNGRYPGTFVTIYGTGRRR